MNCSKLKKREKMFFTFLFIITFRSSLRSSIEFANFYQLSPKLTYGGVDVNRVS